MSMQADWFLARMLSDHTIHVQVEKSDRGDSKLME